MKRLLMLWLAIILLWVLPVPARAQYVIKEADTQYELFNYIKAITLYKQAYQKKKTLHAAERLAQCYMLTQNYEQTESWYAIVVDMPGRSAEDLLNYARALQNNAKYAEAKQVYIQYTDLNKQVTTAQQNNWVSSCDSAMVWMKSPRHVNIENIKALNTPQSDWGAVAYRDEIVFASDRANGPNSETIQASRPFLKFDAGKVPDKRIYGWTGNGYLRLYQQKESEISPFPITVKTDYHIGPASFTADGNELYFTLTRIPKKSEYNKKGNPITVNIEIYSCKKDDAGKWGTPVAFKYNKVGSYSIGDPCVSKDGKTLYFVSDMPGGKGGMDIYYCKKTIADDWALPVNLGSVNTEGNERTPSFDEANNFYFSSDGYIGMGGLDIFKSLSIDNQFSVPVNMGYPVNSPRDDISCVFVTPTTGYLASNRAGGLGSDDIYRFNMEKPLAPEPKPEFKLKGVVYEKSTRYPIISAIVSLKKVNSTPLKVQTDASGNFEYTLEASADYDLTGDKTGYLHDAAGVTTRNLVRSMVIKQDLYLERIVPGKEMILPRIYYDFDRSDIRSDAAIELDKLIKLLNDNPIIRIELRSHTDSRGNDLYNMQLSQRRAGSAVQYLLNNGISKDRLTAKGFGETRLLNRCANGIKCSEPEHQLNRRTAFAITKY